MSTAVYLKSQSLIDKEIEGGLLLFDNSSGRMVQLNSTARLLWQKSGDSFGEGDLKEIVEKNCTSIRNLDADISKFVKTALKTGLVTAGEKG